jgi:hypothetical protein
MRLALSVVARPSGLVIWEGPSPFNGRAVVIIATGLDKRSDNPKTGDMVQLWTLPADEEPHASVAQGTDDTVCGACPLRSGGGCYVRVFQAPLAVWRAWRRGVYPRWDGADLAPFAGRMVRFGAYGEPVSLPLPILSRIAGAAAGWTGYTHAHREPRFAGYRRHLMASVESAKDARAARRRGWRTFRLLAGGARRVRGEITCPASEEAGKRLTCAECGVCDGTRGREGTTRRASVVIRPHGAAAGRIV